MATIGTGRVGAIVADALAIAGLAWHAARLRRAARAPRPSDYVADAFFGITWCWGWGLREDPTLGLIKPPRGGYPRLQAWGGAA